MPRFLLRSHLPRPVRRLALALLLAGAAGPAAAQFGLPSPPPLPQLPSPAGALQLPGGPPRAADLLGQRRAAVDALLRREPLRLERDPGGAPIVRGELLLSSPSQALLATAQAAGFEPVREEQLPGLGLRLLTLRTPPGLDTAAARELLGRLEGGAGADFNHLYLPSGRADAAPGGRAPAAKEAAPAADGGAPASAGPRLGLVDGGVEERHPALRGIALKRQGCDGRTVPDAHGTAVASLLVGGGAGARAGRAAASLHAADIYCGDPAAGTVARVVQALDWLAREGVPVVNLSLVGPPNRLLEEAVRRMAVRGHLLVAAVGNDGPAAAPLYPAAYAGAVVGVTGVDGRRRVLPEALRGPQVAFAAQGAGLRAARGDRGEAEVRGTSFAAPQVAARLAALLPAPEPQAAQRALQRLAAEALDLGAAGRDPVFGQGLVLPASGAPDGL